MKLRRKRCYGIAFILILILSSTVCLPTKNHTSPRSIIRPNDQIKDKDETLLGEFFRRTHSLTILTKKNLNSVWDFVKSWLRLIFLISFRRQLSSIEAFFCVKSKTDSHFTVKLLQRSKRSISDYLVYKRANI